METPADDVEPLIIKDIKVDRRLLDARPIRRCLVDECQSHCCGGGVYISAEQSEDVLANHAAIQPHLPADRRDPALWFDGEWVPDDDHPAGGLTTGTSVVDDPTHPTGTNCIFLRPDRKCALQVTGLAAGQHPWRFKPFYCALHPLTFEEHVLVLAEESEMYLEGGSCNRPAAAPPIPIYRLFEMEMKLVLGDDGYAELDARANGRGAGSPS